MVADVKILKVPIDMDVSILYIAKTEKGVYPFLVKKLGDNYVVVMLRTFPADSGRVQYLYDLPAVDVLDFERLRRPRLSDKYNGWEAKVYEFGILEYILKKEAEEEETE